MAENEGSGSRFQIVERVLKAAPGLIAILAIVLGGFFSWFGLHLGETDIKALAAAVVLFGLGIYCSVLWLGARRQSGAKAGQIRDWVQSAPSAAVRGAVSFNAHDDALPGETRRRLASKIASSILNTGFRAGVVYGEAGVGKTSLLFAGVEKVLKATSPAIQVYAIDCRATDPATQKMLAANRPQPIGEASAPAAVQADIQRVTIVDQFEEWLVPQSGMASSTRSRRTCALS